MIDWNALDMEVERGRRDFEQRLANGLKEINERMQRVERRWEKDEEDRRGEWEALAERLMTAEEKHQHYNDGLLRKMAVMTNEQINILREFSEDIREEFAKNRARLDEGRAETRAQTEAILKMLDRLPPN